MSHPFMKKGAFMESQAQLRSSPKPQKSRTLGPAFSKSKISGSD
jgi:hypothetical protein